VQKEINKGTKNVWTTIYLSLFGTKAEEPGEISLYIVLLILSYGIMDGQQLTECSLLKEKYLTKERENTM
jgi:hypothetical protein